MLILKIYIVLKQEDPVQAVLKGFSIKVVSVRGKLIFHSLIKSSFEILLYELFYILKERTAQFFFSPTFRATVDMMS